MMNKSLSDENNPIIVKINIVKNGAKWYNTGHTAEKLMPNLIVGLGAAMPAFAESFPSNGYMLENKTYSNAATGENMGAYDGTVTATAEDAE